MTSQNAVTSSVLLSRALIVINLLLAIASSAQGEDSPLSSNLQTAKQWQLFTYNFEPNAPVNDMNFYNPNNVLATGIAVSYDRIFIATPKLFSGVPSAINFISKADYQDSPVLQAYPDWSYSTTARTDFNCSDLVIVSVYRLRIDSCNRLWVLDAGVSRSLEDYEITCPPKILVIDLATNNVVRRIDFPRGVLRGESLFTNLVIDETTAKSGTCDDVFVYISDTVEPAIVVYDSQRDVTYRLSHPAMYPDPDFAESQILNDRFILMDGVVGLAFDASKGILYFQPLATDRTFAITREVLRAGPIPITQVLPIKLVGKKSSQGISLAFAPDDGSLIFSPLTETAIAAWNPTTNKQEVLAYDQDRLQFVADMSTTPYEPGVLYAVSSKFHRFFLKSLNPNEINNRILRIQLPSSGATHPLTAPPRLPTGLDLASFGLKPLGIPATHFYSNALDKIQLARPASGYFTSAAALPKTRLPYSHALRNPFTALNQGEAFPPSRGNRDAYQVSYLDRLGPVTPIPQSPSHVRGRGYYYGSPYAALK